MTDDYANPHTTRDEVIRSALGRSAITFDPKKADMTDARQAAFITNSIALRVLNVALVSFDP